MEKWNFSDFLNFRMMITPIIIKWVYIAVAIILALGTFLVAFETRHGGLAMFVLLSGVLGQVLLRVVCEQIVLFFSIHQELVRVREDATPHQELLRVNAADTPAPQPEDI